MFGDINKAEIMGNLTRDPELRNISSGTSVCNFSVATNRRFQQNGEWKEDVEFHNVVIWGQRAESFARRAKKGTRVYIEGRLQTRTWEDQNGSKQFKTEIIVSRVILIDRYEKGDEFSPNEVSGKTDQEAQGEQEDEKKVDKDIKKEKPVVEEDSIDPDDLPF